MKPIINQLIIIIAFGLSIKAMYDFTPQTSGWTRIVLFVAFGLMQFILGLFFMQEDFRRDVDNLNLIEQKEVK